MNGPEGPPAAETPVLEVRDLTVSATGSRRKGPRRTLLDGVSFRVMPGESLGIIGESGSGKSLTSLSILRLLPRGLHVDAGVIRLKGVDILSLDQRDMRRLRGPAISMVLQDPMSSLDPCFRIRTQMREALYAGGENNVSGAEVEEICADLLRRVRLPDAKAILDKYPHELSGGMRQRVVSAIALARSPDVLIADEPTTALDVTTQSHYLSMLKQQQEATGFSLIFISHDLLLVKHLCDRVLVMYAGQLVEQGPLKEVIANPQHPYTRALLNSIPKPDIDAELYPIPGYPPDPAAYPLGCRFAPRCEIRRDPCIAAVPPITPRYGAARGARCFATEAEGWIS